MKKFVVSMSILFLASTLFAGTGRKVVKMSQPAYPALAKQMHLSGTVKLEATVTSAGKIKEVKLLGGHPVLSDAAIAAAKNWQYEPAAQETVETIAVNFISQQ